MEYNAQASNLLRIPHEIIYSFVLPHLSSSELLRMRLVCKQLQKYSNDFIENHFEMEINETNFTITDYINSGFQFKRIYLNNPSNHFFQNPAISEFVQLCSSNITHLRVNYFETCYSEQENNFFTALTNLQHLVIKNTIFKSKCSNETILNEPCYLPESFTNLLTLKFGKFTSEERLSEVYIYDFIKHCPKIEFLKLPIFHEFKGHVPEETVIDTQRVSDILNGNQPKSLKFYDLQNFDSQPVSKYFDPSNILSFCMENNVKLLNVDVSNKHVANLVSKSNDFLGLLVSVQNIHQQMFLKEIPNMKKLVLDAKRMNSNNQRIDIVMDANGRNPVAFSPDGPRWPQLSTLDIRIGSKPIKRTSEGKTLLAETQRIPLETIYDFIFGKVEYKELKNLNIRFDKEASNGTVSPRVRDIISSCENVTKLTVSNWKGVHKIGSKLWTGLPLLEEVTIDKCPMVSDLSFLGSSNKNPTSAFLELKNLKSLTLSRLDSMPQITDVAFEKVFKHLKVKKFYLTSKRPIQNVTGKGVQQLLEGQFINHVKKFPFDKWSLESLSDQEFAELQTLFTALVL